MKDAATVVKVWTTDQGEHLGPMHALAERAMPLVQRIALRRGRTIDYLLDRDFDPSFHDFLYHPIDVFDHFDRDFDALLDKLGFYGGK